MDDGPMVVAAVSHGFSWSTRKSEARLKRTVVNRCRCGGTVWWHVRSVDLKDDVVREGVSCSVCGDVVAFEEKCGVCLRTSHLGDCRMEAV